MADLGGLPDIGNIMGNMGGEGLKPQPRGTTEMSASRETSQTPTGGGDEIGVAAMNNESKVLHELGVQIERNDSRMERSIIASQAAADREHAEKRADEKAHEPVNRMTSMFAQLKGVQGSMPASVSGGESVNPGLSVVPSQVAADLAKADMARNIS